MNQNKIESASAISAKVGKLIARNNSKKLAKINAGGSAMWDEVQKLTRATKSTAFPPSITAELLNQHYCSISTDPTYSSPSVKLTATQNIGSISEFKVFKLLSNLQATASGPDGLPFWF
jgi:hypothetical protein